jgi:hypothetical protein
MGQPVPAPPYNHVPTGHTIAAATIRQGMLLILDNSGGGVGRAKEFAADDADFASTAMEGGLLGFARHAAIAGQPVEYDKIIGGMQWAIETYTTAPSSTELGVAPTTYYTLRNDGGTVKVNLGTTTNGVARFDAILPKLPPTTTARGNQWPDTGLAAGDKVLISFPEAVRHHK